MRILKKLTKKEKRRYNLFLFLYQADQSFIVLTSVWACTQVSDSPMQQVSVIAH